MRTGMREAGRRGARGRRRGRGSDGAGRERRPGDGDHVRGLLRPAAQGVGQPAEVPAAGGGEGHPGEVGGPGEVSGGVRQEGRVAPGRGRRLHGPVPLSRQRRQHRHRLRYRTHVGAAGRVRREPEPVHPRRRRYVHVAGGRRDRRQAGRDERDRHDHRPRDGKRLVHRLALAHDRRARGHRGPRCARLPDGWRVHRSDLRAHGASPILVRHQGTIGPSPVEIVDFFDFGVFRVQQPAGELHAREVRSAF